MGHHPPVLVHLLPLLFFLLSPSIFPPRPVLADTECPDIKTPEDAMEYLDNSDASSSGLSNDTIVRILLGCKGQFNFTIDQIKEFYNARQLQYMQFVARKYPLCIRPGDVDHFQNKTMVTFFTKVLTRLDAINEEFAAKSYAEKASDIQTWKPWDPSPYNDPLVFYSIMIDSESTNKRGDGTTFHQRMRLRITADRKGGTWQGVIIQAIDGNLGVPFGRFTLFDGPDCTDYRSPLLATSPKIWFPNKEVVSCRYRPKHSYVHPQVMIVGGGGAPPITNWIAYFNWIDTPCHEVATFQFLVILVKNGTADPPEMYPLYTEVYEMKRPHSYDGVPTYFYPDPRRKPAFDHKVQCRPNVNDGEHPPPRDREKEPKVTQCMNHTAVKCSEANCHMGLFSPCDKSRIPYNKAYDDCIMNASLSADGETCPPGPFSCNKSPKTRTEWLEIRQKRILMLRDCYYHIPRGRDGPNDPGNCNLSDTADFTHLRPKPDLPTLPPTPIIPVRKRRAAVHQETTPGHETTTHEPDPDEHHFTERELFYFEFRRIGIQHYKFNKRLHGFLMILAYLVINPCSTYMARYFKETPGVSCCGVPRWLMTHVVMSFVSILVMWLGFVAAMGNAGRGVVNCDYVTNGGLNVTCTDYQKSGLHMFLGALTMVAYHLSAATGWTRPKDSKSMYMTTHSIAGYFTLIGATISGMIVNASLCTEIMVEVVTLLGLTFFIFLVQTCVQWAQDKRMGQKDRHFFPILEGVKIREAGEAPCHCMKAFVYILAILLHLFVGGLVLLSYLYINEQDLYEDRFIEEKEFTVKGLFVAECKIANYEKLINASLPAAAAARQ